MKSAAWGVIARVLSDDGFRKRDGFGAERMLPIDRSVAKGQLQTGNASGKRKVTSAAEDLAVGEAFLARCPRS